MQYWPAPQSVLPLHVFPGVRAELHPLPSPKTKPSKAKPRTKRNGRSRTVVDEATAVPGRKARESRPDAEGNHRILMVGETAHPLILMSAGRVAKLRGPAANHQHRRPELDRLAALVVGRGAQLHDAELGARARCANIDDLPLEVQHVARAHRLRPAQIFHAGADRAARGTKVALD